MAENATRDNMTLKEVIESRMHMYDQKLQSHDAGEFRLYMKGWFSAYQDLLGLLEHYHFNTDQVVIESATDNH